jgi:beta-galactosidase
LRLQAFSHLASGAQMVEYWHWATTANAIETYWRGLLSQDYKPNAVYAEASTVGADLKRIGPKLAGMTKRNRVAIYVSNTALSAFDSFKPDGGVDYNQVLRPFYDALYRMNVEVDILSPDSTAKLDDYKLIVVPALYAASDAEIGRLNDFAKRGGHLLYTFKSGFSDENTKVRYATQPGAIAEAAGVTYQQFTIPEGVTLDGDPFGVGEKDNTARWWMEMLTPTTAKVVARYKHPSWPASAAMTRNDWGKGEVSYIGFMPSDALVERIVAAEVERAGVQPTLPGVRFPLIVKGGTLKNGHRVNYVFNYSASPQHLSFTRGGTELLKTRKVAAGAPLSLSPWDVAIVEEDGR